MNPLNSSDPKERAVPTSSRTIIWDGPDLPCINICHGDSVTDVVYKLATLLCQYMTATNLSDLDLKCLFDQCQSCPEPEKSLKNVLQMIIDKLEECCCSEEETPSNNDLVLEGIYNPNLFLPTELRYADENGDLVTRLPHTEYSQLLARELAKQIGITSNLSNSLNELEGRVEDLENQETPEVEYPEIQSQIIGDEALHPLEEVVEALDTTLYELEQMTGNPSEIAQAISKQCEGLSSEDAFSVDGTMSSISGWKTTVNNQADSITNLWLTVCDIREGLKSLFSTTQVTCSAVQVDFAAVLSNNSQTLNLYFAGYTVLPNGFEDCNPEGCAVTIADQSGNTFTTYVSLASASITSSPVQITIGEAGLTQTDDFTITLNSCVTNGSLSCEKVVVKQVTNYINVCPVLAAYPTNNTITFFFNPVLNDNVNYEVQLLSGSLSPITIIDQHDFANPTGPVTGAFISLTPSTEYHLRVVVYANGDETPTYCSIKSVTTLAE